MRATLLVLAIWLAGGCTAVPDAVTERPDLPSCAPDEAIFLPPGQGVGDVDDPEAALRAIDCINSAWEAGEAMELEFTLMGVEGQEYRAIIQVFADSSVDYFTKTDEGWAAYLGCWSIAFPDPGVPDPIKCEEILDL
jgi:hypothetical protein